MLEIFCIVNSSHMENYAWSLHYVFINFGYPLHPVWIKCYPILERSVPL